MEFAGNNGLIFVQKLLELDFIERGIDVSHESGEVILVVSERTQDYVPISNARLLEVLKNTVSILSRSESDGALAALQSHFLTQLSLLAEVVLSYNSSTVIVVSRSSELLAEETTLMKSFLSVSSFSPKAYGLATRNS